MIHNINGDYEKGRDALELFEPRFFNRDERQAAIHQDPELACMAGWALLHTGDEEMGIELLNISIDHIENELPKFIEHADRYEIAYCYMATQQREKAIASIETRVAHKHYSGWWFMTRMPQMEPLWGTPRFEAAMQKIKDEMAIQRASVERMNSEAGA